MIRELRKVVSRSRGRYFAWHGSIRLRGKQERLMARRDLRRGKEPEPRYATGKMWID